MTKKLFSTIGFVFMITFVLSANAEEFNFKSIDSIEQTISYQLTDALLIDKNISYPDSIKFEVEGTDGLIVVSIPKTMPILATETQPTIVLLNGEEIVNIPEDDTKCHFNYKITVNDIAKLEFLFAYWPERPLPVYYFDVPADCNMPFDDSIEKIKNKVCSNEKFWKFMNNRDEVVCLKTSENSFSELSDRGYLKPTEITITKKYN